MRDELKLPQSLNEEVQVLQELFVDLFELVKVQKLLLDNQQKQIDNICKTLGKETYEDFVKETGLRELHRAATSDYFKDRERIAKEWEEKNES